LEKLALQKAERAAAMRRQAIAQKKSLESKIARLLERHQRLVKLSRTEKQRQSRLKRALGRLKARVSKVRDALEEELSRAQSARRARIREEKLARKAAALRKELLGTKKRLARQIARVKKLRSTDAPSKKTKHQRQKLRMQRRAMLAQIKKLRARRRTAQTRLQRVEHKHRNAASHAVKLERRLARARAALKRASRRRDRAQSAVEKARARLDVTLAERKKEQRLKERLVRERMAERKRLAALSDRRRVVGKALANLEKRLHQKKAQVANTQKKQRLAQKRLQNLVERLKRLRRKMGKEKRKNKRVERQARKLSRKLARARTAYEKAQRNHRKNAARRRKRAQRQRTAKTRRAAVRARHAKRNRRKRRTRRKIKVKARVQSVKFRDTGQSHRVVLKIAGPYEYNIQRTKQNKVLLRLYGVHLPKTMERGLDASAFKGPVGRVSTYRNRRTRGCVDMLVALKNPARFKVNRKGRTLWVDFLKKSRGSWRRKLAAAGPRSAQRRAVDISSARVSGYSSRGRRRPSRRRLARSWKRRYQVRGHNLGPRVDMDFKGADLHNVLRLIGQVWKKNIVIPDDVQGRVTIRMENVRVGRALEVILKAKGLGLVWEGRRIIRVAKSETIRKEIELIEKSRKVERKERPVVMRVIHVSYADAQKIAKQLQENVLSKKGKVTFNKRTNTIIIRDVLPNIQVAKKLVRTLDTPTPQVLIEARIVEARSTFLREVGVQWGGSVLANSGTGAPTGLLFPFSVGAAGGADDDVTRTGGVLGAGASNPNFAVNLPATVGSGQGGALGLSLGTLGGLANINLRLSAMEETGQVRIVSAPKITTLDNVEAKIEQGVRIPISVVSAQGVNTKFEEANLGLKVTPHVTADGRIRLKMEVEKNEPDFVNTGARGDPTILKKTATSEMLIPDGDTAVIGGIYSRKTSVSYSKVPWFADIPIIGWLFKKRAESDERSEVLIFVTPRIIKPGKAKVAKTGR
jgi:type IV pilus assembly protein PilQ